MFNQLVW